MIQPTDLRTAYLKNPLGIDILNPGISWKVTQAKKQTASEVRVSINGEPFWSLGLAQGSSMHQVFSLPLQSRDRVQWQVRLTDENGIQGEWSETSSFEMGFLKNSDWVAKWIMGNYAHSDKPRIRYPVDCFKKRFSRRSPVTRARLYITACGFYEAKLNGARVGDQVLTPGSTAFQKRVHYQTYDVTDLIQNENELCIELADGFYASKTGVFGTAKIYGHEPKLLAQLEIADEYGQVQIVRTDDSFLWSNDGPIRSADLKDGEIVNSNFTPSYSGKALVTTYKGSVCCSNNVPVREMERFEHPRVICCPDGQTVLDFGQNIAGYMRATVQGPKGHQCSMVFGEKLDSNGKFTYKNISWQGDYNKCHFQTNDFICNGLRQTYKPSFTVMGFQYVLLQNWPEEIKTENFCAIAVYSAMDTTFAFDSSDPGLNRIVKNTFWSVKGNFLDVPTDCPTRERAGWTGDAQLFFNTGNYMMDQRSFFRKWLHDIVDCQKENGMVYNINPSKNEWPAIVEWLSIEGSAGWGDALVLIPYYYWKRYGDDSLIRGFWQPMQKCFLFYSRRMGKRNLLSLFSPKRSQYDSYLCACGRDFGEWTEPKDCAPPMSKMLIPMAEEATAYLCYSARLMSEMARHLGETADSSEYGLIAENIGEAYNYYFVQDGQIESNRMCKYVRPCGLGLAKGQARAELLKKIVRLNRERDYKTGTGFLATPFVLGLLTEAGAGDDAYKMLTNPDSGWMQQINLGATTVWENWEPDASLNHYSKGACCQWLFDSLSGIQLDGRPNHFVIKPSTVSQLDYLSFEYDSVYGQVASSWRKTATGHQFRITIPANCEAEVYIPGQTLQTVGAGEHEFLGGERGNS